MVFSLRMGMPTSPAILLVHLNNQRGRKGRFQTGAQQG